MSTKRREGSQTLRDAAGLVVCSCGCGRHPVAPRRTWFSDQCVQAWLNINDPARIRQKVEARDHGICALCGVDAPLQHRIATETYRFWMWLARRRAEEMMHAHTLPCPPGETLAWGHAHDWARAQVEEQFAASPLRPFWKSMHAWEADHIVPVIEGGGQCGLEGYRTLCLPCHRKETAALARRRAERRRLAAQPELSLESLD